MPLDERILPRSSSDHSETMNSTQLRGDRIAKTLRKMTLIGRYDQMPAERLQEFCRSINPSWPLEVLGLIKTVYPDYEPDIGWLGIGLPSLEASLPSGLCSICGVAGLRGEFRNESALNIVHRHRHLQLICRKDGKKGRRRMGVPRIRHEPRFSSTLITDDDEYRFVRSAGKGGCQL